MKEIDDYVHQLFSNFEENDDLKGLKKKTKIELDEKFDTLTQQGMSAEDALLKIKIEFGAKECIMFQLNEEKRIDNYNKFKAAYPKLKNAGLLSIALVTVFALTLSGTTELKLQSLVIWIILIILLVGFVMVVEYIDYWFGNRYSYLKPEKTDKQLKKEQKHKEKAQTKANSKQQKQQNKAHKKNAKNNRKRKK